MNVKVTEGRNDPESIYLRETSGHALEVYSLSSQQLGILAGGFLRKSETPILPFRKFLLGAEPGTWLKGWRSQYWSLPEKSLHPIISVHVLKIGLVGLVSDPEVRAKSIPCLPAPQVSVLQCLRRRLGVV